MLPAPLDERGVSGYNGSIDGVIAAWLDAKFQKSQSEKTRREYTADLASFRRFLARHRRDLDAPPEMITPALQAWAGQPKHDQRGMPRPVASATRNRRLAVVSSFYDYARRNKALALAYNPAEIVERSKVQAYRGVASRAPDQIAKALESIDRDSPKGLRDYAILSLALFTGRRVSEIAGLTIGDVEGWASASLLIRFHTKGGRIMQDEIPPELSAVIRQYIEVVFLEHPTSYSSAFPLWVSFKRTGQPLGIQAIQNLCETYLGTSKAHVLRHSFAMGMVAVGATVPELKTRLGHASLATTTLYVEELQAAKNSKAAELLAAFGISRK